MNYLSSFYESNPPEEKVKRKLRCRIGPSIKNLQVYNVNDEKDPHFIDNEYFTGQIVVRVKNFTGITRGKKEPIHDLPYFKSKKRMFSLQISGRFKQEFDAEDILFGAEFERKVNPPTGAWLAVKFANLIDPALQTDMYGDRPWLYSPLLCAMNIVNIAKNTTPLPSGNPELSIPSSEKGDASKLVGEWTWVGDKELHEDNTLLLPPPIPDSSTSGGVEIDDDDGDDDVKFSIDDIAARRKYFQTKANRRIKVFRKDLNYNFEIFAPFIDLNTFDLSLGINVNVHKYLTGQPIRLLAKSRSLDKPLFVVEFDLIVDPNSDADSSSATSLSSTKSSKSRKSSKA